MRAFHHVGLVTQTPQAGETYFDSIQVWATNPAVDPNKIEWVRCAPGSPLANTEVARLPHVAFAVDDLDAEVAGKTLLAGPLTVVPGIRIAYFLLDGAVVEYMECK